MAYLVLCTFDLENAKSKDYDDAYDALEEIGLSKNVESDSGKDITLPNTVTIGKFSGESKLEVRNSIIKQIKNKFKQLGFKSKIFITVSSGWSWIQSNT